MEKTVKAQNIEMLGKIASGLGDLINDVVFLGGCTTSLLVTDSVVPDARRTLDVDCIADIISLKKYHELENELRERGFKQVLEDDVICRWRYDDVILDLMPIDEKILGFTNRWYPSAFDNTTKILLPSNIFISIVNAPYFIATKLEAFKSRGRNDFLLSHDFEDIITLLDGRPEVIAEIKSSDRELKEYLGLSFKEINSSSLFHDALPGHLNYGAVRNERVSAVLDRIAQIIEGK